MVHNGRDRETTAARTEHRSRFTYSQLVKSKFISRKDKMLTKLYIKACDGFPKFRKFTRKHMYQFMAKLYQKKDWSFMNYGYMPLAQGRR